MIQERNGVAVGSRRRWYIYLLVAAGGLLSGYALHRSPATVIYRQTPAVNSTQVACSEASYDDTMGEVFTCDDGSIKVLRSDGTIKVTR